MSKKKTEILNQNELFQLAGMSERIKGAMQQKNINSYSDLNNKIRAKRAVSPDLSIYTKIDAPPSLDQNYYNMTINNLIVIADALDVSTDYLLGLTDVSEKKSNIKLDSLGLSSKSLKHLHFLKTKASNYDRSNIEYTSEFWENPFKRKLSILNWIIEHDTNEDTEENTDFLLLLYLAIMCKFNSYRGSLFEPLLHLAENAINKDKEEYENACWHYNQLSNLVFNSEAEKEQYSKAIKEKMEHAKLKYENNRANNEQNLKIITDYLDKGMVPIADPLTFDNYIIKLPPPTENILDNIIEIIKKWKDEYEHGKYAERMLQQEKIYKKQIEHLKKLHESLSDLPHNI